MNSYFKFASPERNNPLLRNRWWDCLSFFLIWTVLVITAHRLSATNWTDDLPSVLKITIISFWFGTALGYSLFRPPIASLFGFCYGIFFIGSQLGSNFESEVLWTERLYTIYLRLSLSFQRLSLNQPVQDNLLFLLSMLIIFWLLGMNAGYSFSRYANAWRIIIPLAVCITVIHSYDAFVARRIWYLVAFSFFALLILIRLELIKSVRLWSQQNVHVPSQFSWDVLRYGLRVVLILSLGAWLIPVNTSAFKDVMAFWEKAKQPFQAIRDDFENAFASLRVTVASSPDYYGQTLNLGNGNVLTDTEVFSVLVPTSPPEDVRLFWRARVYDHYENGKWSISALSLRTLPPSSTELKFPQYPQRARGLYSFYFATNQPLITIYAPPQPQWTNLGSRIEFIPNPDGTVDLLAIRSSPPLPANTTYAVRSSLSRTTVENLMKAGTDYPEWIKERYLQLPSDITARTKELAVSITQNYDTPYEKTLAITKYLRSNIQYIERLENLPQDKEILDWFLFDEKRGFCNYYASAEVILLRSIGIPARLAVGYAQGENDELNNANVYVVLQKDAHAWPEVYFPGIGWVEFEPTASQPELIRSPSTMDTQSIEPEIPESFPYNEKFNPNRSERGTDSPQPRTFTQTPLFRSLILLIGFILLSAIVISQRKSVEVLTTRLPIYLENNLRSRGINPPKLLVQWNSRTRLSLIEKSFSEVNRSLRLLHYPPPPHATPMERSKMLSTLIPEASDSIEVILNAYHEFLYHQQGVEPQSIQKAVVTLQHLTRRKQIQQTFLSQSS